MKNKSFKLSKPTKDFSASKGVIYSTINIIDYSKGKHITSRVCDRYMRDMGFDNLYDKMFEVVGLEPF